MAVMSRLRFVILLTIMLLFSLCGASMVVEGRVGGWPVFLVFSSIAVILVTVRFPPKPTLGKSVSIIDAYPEPVTLVGQRRRNILVAVASGVLASMPIALLLTTPSSGDAIAHLIFSTIFGVPALVLAAAAIRPNRLTLDSEGMKLTTLRSTKRWRWRDVDEFTPVASVTRGAKVIPVRQIIGFNDRNAKRPGRLALQSGKNSIFANQFAVSDQELALALNFWRRRAVPD